MAVTKYSVEYLQTAMDELAGIVAYYSQFSEETVTGFLNELQEMEYALSLTPYAHTIRKNGSRRANFNIYPYFVSYRIQELEKRIIITGQPKRSDPNAQHP